jgi:signal transduction histidine kinase
MNVQQPKQPPPEVLVVDDTPANLNLLSEIIRGLGFKVRPVPRGDLALEAAAVCPPDLILLDVDMPDMDGFEVCARLKKDPVLSEIPVIFISALTSVTDKVRGFTSGGVDYIPKPFQSEEVIARVTAHLEIRRQRLELQRNYDRVRELEQLRANLVHTVVHELRSPLTVLFSLLYSVKMESDTPRQVLEDVELALTTAMKMGSLITSALDVNSMADGTVQLRSKDCDLVSLAREVIGEFSELIGNRRIELEASPLSIHRSIDKELIARVLQNLLGNALRFSPQNSEIRVVILEQNGAVRVTIIDDGPTIPQAFREHIFNTIVHPKPSGRDARPSTGLGLPFCKLAIEAHGGLIGLESTDETRSNRFWFSLP